MYYVDTHARVLFILHEKWSGCDQVWIRTGWLTSSITIILKFFRIPQEQQ